MLATFFVGCSKESNVENYKNDVTLQNAPLDFDLKAALINFQYQFWSNLSLHSLADIQNTINTEDYDKLLSMAKISEDEIQEIIMHIQLNYEQNNTTFIDENDCNCSEEEIDLQKIVNFVAMIQVMGGAESFINGFSIHGVDLKSSSGPDWDRVYACLGACSLTCMSVSWSPALWAACMAACGTICYTVEY